MAEIKDLAEETVAACQTVVNVVNDVEFFSSGNSTTLQHTQGRGGDQKSKGENMNCKKLNLRISFSSFFFKSSETTARYRWSN